MNRLHAWLRRGKVPPSPEVAPPERRAWLHVGGVPVRVGIRSLMLPAIAFLLASEHSNNPLPLLEALSADEVVVLMLAMLAALIAHELGHVLAGVFVKMPLGSIRLDWVLPAVEYDRHAPEAADAQRRLWFFLGGPLYSTLLAVVALTFTFVATGAGWVFAFQAFAFGNAVQALNGLPGRSAGLVFAVVGLFGLGAEPPARTIAVTLLMAGIALVVLGNRSQSDGDQALAAWREIRANRRVEGAG